MAVATWAGKWELYFEPRGQCSNVSLVDIGSHDSLEPYASFPWLPLKLGMRKGPVQDKTQMVRSNSLCLQSKSAASLGCAWKVAGSPLSAADHHKSDVSHAINQKNLRESAEAQMAVVKEHDCLHNPSS